VMPIGAPPRHMATRNVGRKPLRTMRRASSIESRSSESAEIKCFSMGGLFGSWAGAGSGANYALSAVAGFDLDASGPRRGAYPLLAEETEQGSDYRLGRIFLYEVTRVRHATQCCGWNAGRELTAPLDGNPTILLAPEVRSAVHPPKSWATTLGFWMCQ